MLVRVHVRRCMALVLLVTGLITLSIPDESVAEPEPVPKLLLAVAGEADPRLVETVSKHISLECDIPVAVSTQRFGVALSPSNQANMVLSSLGTNECLTLVLMNIPQEDTSFRLAVLAERRIAILDTGWLAKRDADGEERASEGTFTSRVKKESMCAFGLLLGMPSCLYPRCCLSEAKTYFELDEKGQDFCPPCSLVFEYITGRGLRPPFLK